MIDSERLHLSDADRAMLAGERGEAARLALRILLPMARIYGAEALLDIEHAHVDGVLLHGESGLDFAERLLTAGGQVVVPTTLNVGAYDLLHPEIYQGDEQTAAQARRLMEVYVEMGCEPIFTCAPYQSGARPPFGTQIAWAESNAIVFRQFGTRGEDATLWRFHRYLLRHHRTSPRLRAAFKRESPRSFVIPTRGDTGSLARRFRALSGARLPGGGDLWGL